MQSAAAVAARRAGDSVGAMAVKGRVLYAEDQQSSRIVTTALLERMGYVVDAVEDGELAVQKAQAQRYDVILLDIEMPVMDGVSAARLIKSGENPCNGAPILALSAFLADSTEQCEWRDAFDWALPKPASSTELKKVLEQFAHRQEPEPDDRGTFALAQYLPKGAWVRLAQHAGDEMAMLALTASACEEAQDMDRLNEALDAMRSLAVSFGAADVAKEAERVFRGLGEQRSLGLVNAIARWRLCVQ
jgi:CheY-like chemotaxis protein